MNKPLRVFALTGIRSEYDLFYPILKGLENDPAFSLGVVVSGAHLTDLHQYSVKQIEADGFSIVARINNLIMSDDSVDKIRSIGALLQGLADVFAREKPDLFLVLGDREESITGALAAAQALVPVVHLIGGDHTHPLSGNIDESIRHATTKLSHVHLTMAEEHRQRVIKLGEDPARVFVVGNPGIDRLRTETFSSVTELSQLLGDSVTRPYAVMIHHPLSSAIETGGAEVKICLDACIKAGLEVFVGMPNSDPGFEGIVQAFKAYENHPKIHFYKNLPRKQFAGLLKGAKVLVGNSSLGLHEAPYLGLPAVNVGERQRGRLAGNNVTFVDAKADAVEVAVQKSAWDEVFRSQIHSGTCLYGDGHAVEKILSIFKGLPSRDKLLAKRITF